MHLLEPEGPDSLFAWGELFAALEMKEYIDARVLEPLAAKLLKEDPKPRPSGRRVSRIRCSPRTRASDTASSTRGRPTGTNPSASSRCFVWVRRSPILRSATAFAGVRDAPTGRSRTAREGAPGVLLETSKDMAQTCRRRS